MKIESGNLVWRSQGALDAGAGNRAGNRCADLRVRTEFLRGRLRVGGGTPNPGAVTESHRNCITHDLPRPARRTRRSPIARPHRNPRGPSAQRFSRRREPRSPSLEQPRHLVVPFHPAPVRLHRGAGAGLPQNPRRGRSETAEGCGVGSPRVLNGSKRGEMKISSDVAVTPSLPSNFHEWPACMQRRYRDTLIKARREGGPRLPDHFTSSRSSPRK